MEATSPDLGPPLAEDAAIIAVSKPVGLATIPERDLSVASLQKLLEARRGERLWVVHRLDKEVSGVVLFARTAEAHRALSMAFERREVDKSYRILAHGSLEQDRGVFDRPIAQFGSGRMGVDERRGKPSQTRYSVLQRGKSFTLAEARPVTGRRHQIRVHFYAAGHPLVGDPRYGDLKAQAAFPRLMLHAHTLRVPHPGGGQIDLTAPVPDDFASLAASLLAR